ncbi:hypothetical protein Nepgr_018524 [Nepenthes gracilis]|uniref:RPW8 domain-containing protein n=1 Tax=Nepenthes gracilis TaxID=150966 RepID=A0AAD3SRI7_NEPGR|nr:hypothetical protein Nepgr_018524 [Nepenthes gracilis]
MAVTDLFAGEIVTELLKHLLSVVKKSALCRTTAESLLKHLNQLLPVIEEVKYSGVELPQSRQTQLDRFSEDLRNGLELCKKILASGRWNVYRHLQLARKMEKLEKKISMFMDRMVPGHVLADVHHLRYDVAERFDRVDASARLIEQRLGALKIGMEGGGWLEEEMRRMEELEERHEDGGVNLGVGLKDGMKKVKEMVIGRDDVGVIGICGIGGSGKTTLAREICKDDQVKRYFDNRILFLTVSQSPNVEGLRSSIWEFLYMGANIRVSQQNLQCEWNVGLRTLMVLDDVWSLSVLEQLLFKRMPGCMTLVVSRIKFPTVFNLSYEMQLLKNDEAVALFCYSAFGQKSIPISANATLIKELVNECKGLPLALKVIGASLRGQDQMYWMSAKNRLLRGEPICESHEIDLLERMKFSIAYLPEKVKECFLDLASFPEDKKIPLDVLINMWVEIHDLDEEEAFAILIELSEKHLLSLMKEARAGDLYSSYFEIYVTQHDVLRDLALHLSKDGNINQRKRLLMPRREQGLLKEWERRADQPFNAQVVSLHTGEMREMDWFPMQFPEAEVLILNFCSNKYCLPPFINNMPKLKALILINHSNSHAVLHNLSVFNNMPNLRSLWFERISVPQFPETTIPSVKTRKISLILCKMNSSSDLSMVDFPWIFPHLTELTMDHCIDLAEVPKSICGLLSLKRLSITNCHILRKLPADLGNLGSLEILRLYACHSLLTLPPGIHELVWLKYLDIAQCGTLACLPEGIGKLMRLEKIDMRECSSIRKLPNSVKLLQSLHRVVCDEEISTKWREVQAAIPQLHLQVVEDFCSLDWLTE